MLTGLINAALADAKEVQIELRSTATIDGWRALASMTELPSLADELSRLYYSYAKGMTVERVREMVKDIPAFRAIVDISYKEYTPLCGVIFELKAGSFLVVFPHFGERDIKVSGYVMGDTILKECSHVASSIVEAFEDQVMPKQSRAGEPLFL